MAALPPRAIAERRAVPLATVKLQHAGGLERLRARLDRDHGGDRRAWIAGLAPLAPKPGGLAASAPIVAVAPWAPLAGRVVDEAGAPLASVHGGGRELRVARRGGARLVLNVYEGSSRMESEVVPLSEGRSATLALSDSGVTLVLLRDDEELERHELELTPGEVNVVRP